GYWRNLLQSERDAIARRFWEVGRLTLEHWLTPRLKWEGITRWPGVYVVNVKQGRGAEELEILLSNGARIAVERVVFACGYRAELANIPYLRGLIDRVAL